MFLELYVSIILLLLSLLVWKLIHGWIFRGRKLMAIPGPQGWPLIGNILQMDSTNPHKTFSEWRRKYGDMFKIKIFQDDVVVLNNHESIQEMLKSETCSSRPYSFRMHEIAFKDIKYIIFAQFSKEFLERKKALMRSLNAYGTGLRKIESITCECIDKLHEDIQMDSDGYRKSFDIRPSIHKCTAGIITMLFYGRKLAESELMELLELVSGEMKFLSPIGLISMLDHLPWLQHLPISAIQDPIRASKYFERWILGKLLKRECGLLKDEACILDSLRRYINKVTNKPLTPGELAGNIADIMLGGFETSTASLYCLIAVLINFPEIQDKMYEEIQQVTKGARPKISDRSNMTYVKAVMEENFRYSSILPLGIPHYSWQDTTINGKHIPKGTVLIANLWGMHHDERYFDEPWEFKPERYIDESEEMLTSDNPVRKHTMPFGTGRRICPGENLARNRIFLILASLMQKYKFLPEDENDIPSWDSRGYESGLVIMPFEYKVKVLLR